MPAVRHKNETVSKAIGPRSERQRSRRDDWKRATTTPITRDDIKNAYFQGIRDGLDEVKKALLAKLDEYVSLIAEDRNKIAEYLKGQGFNPKRAFLNIGDWNNFKLLILVPEADFLNNKFLDVYDLTFKLEQARKAENAHLDIGFINGELSEQDEKRLISDGFYLDWEF